MKRKSENKQKLKYNDEIAYHLTTILRTKFGNPKLSWVSITKVELSPDKSEAKVFWDTFDNLKRGDLKNSLSGIESKARQLLSQEMKVRHTPKLIFVYDSQFDDEKKISDLLQEDLARHLDSKE